MYFKKSVFCEKTACNAGSALIPSLYRNNDTLLMTTQDIHNMTIKAARTTEKDLIAPAIVALLNNVDEKGRVHSSTLRADILKLVRRGLTKYDKSMLPSRNVSRINQTIMNLISHRTLDKMGLASYNTKTGMFKVRAKARQVAVKSISQAF